MEALEIAIRLLPWLVAIMAVASLIVAIWSLNWPSVKGRIDIAIFDQETNWDINSTSRGTNIRRNTEEKFYLSYSYTVEGETYAGSRISPLTQLEWHISSSGEATIWSGARDHAKWYREDTTPDVYYCPSFPQWACLEPGGFIGALFLGFVAAMLFWLI